jgi:hypothetical protein
MIKPKIPQIKIIQGTRKRKSLSETTVHLLNQLRNKHLLKLKVRMNFGEYNDLNRC